jgi:RNA polymerase sigma factor (sigma-70 family)
MKNQHELTDEKLIQFYLSGDPNAMATLVELYKDRIYRSIFTVVQDRHAAEEIFRDVFITLINNMIAGNGMEEGDFLQWAKRIAHNLCMDHMCKIKTVVLPEAGADAEETPALAEVAVGNDYYESHDKIKALIDMLPDNQREVMVLNHYGGLGFNEIAEVMKCSLNTALDTMKFGLNNLQKLMHEKKLVIS